MDIKLNKRSKSIAIVYAIIFILIAILYLAIPFHKNAASWIIVSFTLLSVAISLAICVYAFKDADTLVSKVYGFPVFRIGYIYLTAQIILCFIICAITAFVNTPVWIVIITSVLLLSAAMIGVIAADNARDVAERMDTDTRESTKKIVLFKINMDGLADKCTNAEAKKTVEKLAEEFRYSDPVSCPDTEDIEEKIKDQIAYLKDAIVRDDAKEIKEKAALLSNVLSERNRICKASKR